MWLTLGLSRMIEGDTGGPIVLLRFRDGQTWF
jgi:hypothetical protein